jgi:hypothetical protein
MPRATRSARPATASDPGQRKGDADKDGRRGPPGCRYRGTRSTTRPPSRSPGGSWLNDYTWTTVIRCPFGRSGSSTSLDRSSGSLISRTTGRSASSAVAVTTASIAHRCPERPAFPRSSPDLRAISALTGTTEILDITRCTAASRAPPLSTSVRVMALTATPARLARAVSRYARARESPAASFETPSPSKTRVPPAATLRPAMLLAPHGIMLPAVARSLYGSAARLQLMQQIWSSGCSGGVQPSSCTPPELGNQPL